MLKLSYRDLTVVLILSLASLLFIIVPALNRYPLNLIPLFLLMGFLPGYAALSIYNPLFYYEKLHVKILFTIIMSLLISSLIFIFSFFTGLNLFHHVNFVILILILSLLAIIRRKLYSKRLKSYSEDKSVKKEKPIPKETAKEPVKTVKKEEVKKEAEKPVEIKKAVETKKPTPDKQPPKPVKIPKRFNLDLLLVVILTALCVIFVLVPALNDTGVRTALGLLLVLFLPGYALIAALFPRRDDLDTIERLALSFGLSIAITPLIGLVLNYTPFGIRLDPILVSLTGVTLVLCLVAFIRKRRITKEERFFVDFGGFFSSINESFKGESRTSKILSVVLIFSIILAIATTAYIIVKPKEGESFTEFYILGPNGKASDYPTNLTTGQEGKVIIGIVNHENKKTEYRLVVTSNGTIQKEQTLTLNDGQKLEIPYNFTAGDPGDRKMEFLLFKLPDNNNAYRSLHLWLNITG